MAMTEAEWASSILSGLGEEVAPDLWARVDGIADPIARLNALVPIMYKKDRQVYQSLLSSLGPRPSPTAVVPGKTPEELAREAAEAAAAKAAKHTANVTNARNRAVYDAESFFRQQGIDPTPYMAMINSEFDRIQSTIGEGDDPTRAFSTNVASNFMSGERAKKYREYDSQLDTKFAPGSEKQAIGTSLLDDVIGEILGKQKDSALQYLDRGKARGMYNDVGFNAGISAIDNALSSGRSELGSLGNTVLDKYRGMANTVRDKAYDELGAFDFGDSFSIDPYVTEYEGIINDARNNAGGDLRNLLGGKNFFDLSSLTQQAGQAQGAMNLRDADVATALAERKRKNTMSRGLGSQGAF